MPASSIAVALPERHGRGSFRYFSTIAFHRTKYGRELLVDAASLGEMPTFIQDSRPHVLGFHELLLVTRGQGEVLLDGAAARVESGSLLFTTPGQVREWRLTKRLQGACLFFTDDFMAATFADPRFLERFAYLRARRPAPVLPLRSGEQRQLVARFGLMRREIGALAHDAAEALRALVYEVLVLVNRWYDERHGQDASGAPCDFVERFVRLVERDFARRHLVGEYAAELGVTPGHLGWLCRQRRRMSAGAVIRARIALEARRLLLYTDLSAAQIADRLGFGDPAYFARFFRREVGSAPSRFRRRRLEG
jgi:AraC family transcriptional activator of pobA